MPTVKRNYIIDLDQPPRKRWEKMIKAERSRARTLIQKCIEEAKFSADHAPGGWGMVAKAAFKAARTFVPRLYEMFGGDYEYALDISAWAKGIGLPTEDVVFANLIYEISQAFAAGCCTAMAFDLPGGKGVGHARTMDWPQTGVGRLTCLIHYRGAPAGPFTSVGWPGYVGVLSGIAPGRFSATINQAPQAGLPSPGFLQARWPASFALRYNFENSESYDDVISDLGTTDLVASTLFLIAGTERGEAAVIEHTGKLAKVRKMRGGSIAVANHYQTKPLLSKYGSNEDSRGRYRCARNAAVIAAQAPKTPSVAKILKLTNKDPVFHELTAQQMAFIPATGKFAASFQNTDAAVRDHLNDLAGSLDADD